MTRAELDEAKKKLLKPESEEKEQAETAAIDPAYLRMMQASLNQVVSMASTMNKAVKAIQDMPQPVQTKRLEADIVRDAEGKMIKVIVEVIR
jgi:hypothetical protein